MSQTRSKATKKAGTGKGKKTTSAKAPAKRTAPRRATKAPSPKKTPVAQATAAEAPLLTDDERYRMIAERAYRHAVRRRFRNGSPREDWLAAESEVEALLTTRSDD